MKKMLVLTLVLGCMLFTACADRSIGIIGGADGPTEIIVDDDRGQSRKETVKMVNVDGELYYETDEDNDAVKCGTLDGELTKIEDRFAIPKNSGEANFMAKGYQLGMVKDTIEVPIGDDCEIFKKLDTDEDVLKYQYCYIIEGVLPEARDDSELLVLANTMDITFQEAANKLTSSDSADAKDIYVLPIID